MEALTEQELIAKLKASDEIDGVCRLHNLSELVDLLQIPRRRIRAWLQAGLIQPVEIDHGIPYFDFRQVACAKTLLELTKAGVSTAEIRRSLEKLQSWRGDRAQPLEQLALLERNGRVLLRIEEGLVEPSGQMCFDFGDDAAIYSVQPTSAEGWFQQGIQHEEDGQLKEASAAYRKALMLGGPDCDIAFNLANVLFAQGLHEEACERFRQVIELDPSYGEAWNNLGVVLVELRHPDEAIGAFKQAIGLGYADAHYNLADLLENLGKKAEAREHWRACVRNDPMGPHGRYARGKLS